MPEMRERKSTPLEEQIRAARDCRYGPIHLVRIGAHAIVKIQVGGLWVPVVSEHLDGMFSHIVEPLGIEESIAQCFAARDSLFQFTSHEDWVRHARRRFESAGHTSADTICIDSEGRIVAGGGGFERAESEGAYPVQVYSTRA